MHLNIDRLSAAGASLGSRVLTSGCCQCACGQVDVRRPSCSCGSAGGAANRARVSPSTSTEAIRSPVDVVSIRTGIVSLVRWCEVFQVASPGIFRLMLHTLLTQVRLLPRHVPGLPERFDASQGLLAALNKFVFVRVRTPLGQTLQAEPATSVCDIVCSRMGWQDPIWIVCTASRL